MIRITLISLLTVLLVQFSSAQENYLPGYVIQENGDTLKGLINFLEWDINPSSFKFKKSLDSEIKTFALSDVKEFHVSGETYRKYTIEVDFTPVKTDKLIKLEEAIIKDHTAFYRRLVNGKAELWYLKDNSFKEHFFVKYDSLEIEELTFKRYIKIGKSDRTIHRDERYKGQLSYLFLDCPAVTPKIQDTEYNTNDLVRIFMDYNKCIGVDYSIEIKQSKPKEFHFGIVAGVAISSMYLSDDSGPNTMFKLLDPKLINMTGSLYGVSGTVAMPRNLNLYEFRIEAHVFKHKDEGYDIIVPEYAGTIDYKVENTFLKLAAMIRYKMSLKKTKPFISAGVTYNGSIGGSNYVSLTYDNEYLGTQTKELIPQMKGRMFGLTLGLGVEHGSFFIEGRKEISGKASACDCMSGVTVFSSILVGYSF